MDNPISDEYREFMNQLARMVDVALNGDVHWQDRKLAFMLLVSPFGDKEGNVNYISNANRDDALLLMKNYIARQEETKP